MKVLATVLVAGVVSSILVFVFSIPTYFLWNWLMPEIFGLPEISILQTIGLLFLSAFLFKNTSENSKS